jgi:hypothetical protein
MAVFLDFSKAGNEYRFLLRSRKNEGDFSGRGWEKISNEFFKITIVQNPKNTKN